jgi:hypothetical protein
MNVKRSLILCLIIAAVWCAGLLAGGYHFGETPSDALLGSHCVKVDFVVRMCKTNLP